MVGFCDLLKSASLTLHITQSPEYIGENGITPGGGNIGYVSFLYQCSICHAAAFIKTIPACTEQPGMSDWRIIRQ